MAVRTIKPDSGNDLELQNNSGGAKITIPNSGDIAISGTIGSGTFNGTIGSSATLPAGTIVQAKGGAVSNGGGTLNFTSSGPSGVAEQSTGLAVNIIPKFSNSLIYVMASLNAAAIGQNCGVHWKMEGTGLTTRRSYDSQTTYGSTWKTGAMIGVSVSWTDDGTPITHHWQDTAQSASTVHGYTLMANAETTSTGTYLAINHRGNDANFGSVSYCLVLEIKV
tara:strand:+ start:1240 stop:1905 length:666 start_codon:yes stop_codon:yes gene_type:complete